MKDKKKNTFALNLVDNKKMGDYFLCVQRRILQIIYGTIGQHGFSPDGSLVQKKADEMFNYYSSLFFTEETSEVKSKVYKEICELISLAWKSFYGYSQIESKLTNSLFFEIEPGMIFLNNGEDSENRILPTDQEILDFQADNKEIFVYRPATFGLDIFGVKTINEQGEAKLIQLNPENISDDVKQATTNYLNELFSSLDDDQKRRLIDSNDNSDWVIFNASSLLTKRNFIEM